MDYGFRVGLLLGLGELYTGLWGLKAAYDAVL